MSSKFYILQSTNFGTGEGMGTFLMLTKQSEDVPESFLQEKFRKMFSFEYFYSDANVIRQDSPMFKEYLKYVPKYVEEAIDANDMGAFTYTQYIHMNFS